MHATFWQERWARSQIGFHQEKVNGYLRRHWSALEVASDAAVLVPLCGKSLDLAWLAEQGHRVIGVELAERAVQDFFSERDVQPQVSQRGAFKVYQAGDLQILCGDFFALSREDVADCQAFYDRAALIALPPEMRERYVAHLQAILPDSCQGLLVTLIYDQQQMDGPPFSVEDAEVMQHFATGWSLRMVEEKDVLAGNPRFADSGLAAVDERVFHLTRR
ncbi:thiopurine S-methyltransferase [Ectopseudomonas mendocina]|uniref:Thiopurine S-methyltransferase n=1 Tax=Ectopseudomonas mendocina S5.2 TaxID=1225174 RepID=A0ABM5VX79_ECTME|nr:thiopurine S-methyltransferase [Pseudomonas mendocina]AEB58269.1 thiopurine S-methyltransferase [Pseudomonas mendocina NK-01]ALN19512.1 thiopurine S-methyltransferase [Pseudomonas mendocina S5.2]KER99608.1 thiopurine S-methyltransferase [Pseudomonas mendocina]MDF2074558.1 thiopurine S-methyltransferase [Pseudomonas mendocina]